MLRNSLTEIHSPPGAVRPLSRIPYYDTFHITVGQRREEAFNESSHSKESKELIIWYGVVLQSDEGSQTP